MIKSRKILMLMGLGIWLLSCEDAGKPLVPEINYYSRITEYWTYVDAAETVFEPDRTCVYDATGKLVGKFLLTYDSNGINTQTDVFAYDANGNETQNEYYKYYYTLLPGDATTQYISAGETYDMEGTKQIWYTVTWDPVYHQYTAIDDFKNDEGATVQTASQLCTYFKEPDTPWDGQYRTEQFFYFDAGVKKLKKEYACWYDASTGDYTHELYHVIRGEATDIVPEGQDAAYFYVPFSRNDQGNVYLQSDYFYDDAVDPVPRETDLSFVVAPAAINPLTYNINFACIKDMADMLLIAYDELGNPDQKTYYTSGLIQEIVYFSYDTANRETDKTRYVNGGHKIEEKTVTRYHEESIAGKAYVIKDTYLYRFGEDYTADMRTAASQAEEKVSRLKEEAFRKVKSNHINF